MVISPRRWCLRAWVVPWASLATRDCACRRRLRPAGCFLLGVVRGAFEALCGALCCGSSGMSHAIPSHVCRGLKWGRWDCNVRGGAAESSVIRIACDLWGVRRVDRTPVFGRRPKDAAYHTWGASGLCSQGLLRCCVAGRGCGGARGLVWFCGPGVLRVVGWWCGSGREPCVGSRPGLLSGKRTAESDISKDSIQGLRVKMCVRNRGFSRIDL